jgi:hypothetical protein
VSLPWSDRAQVALMPDEVAMVRFGLSGRILDSRVKAVESGDGVLWQPALDAFAAVLTEQGRRGLRVRVVVSARLAHCLVLPWQDDLADLAEWESFARHAFKQVYCDAAASWSVRVSLAGHGESVFACAIDAGLVAGMERAAAAAGVSLVTIEPYLMTVFNRFRRCIDGDGLLVIAERGYQSCAAIGGGCWQLVSGERFQGSDVAPGILRALRLHAAGIDAPKLWLHLAGEPEAKLELPAPVQVVRLPAAATGAGTRVPGGALYMAMCR